MLHWIFILQTIPLLLLLSDTSHTVSGQRVPIFTYQPDDFIATRGNTVELSCNATGDPSPSYSYTHNSSVVNPTGRVTIVEGKLTIRNYGVSDAGQYVCTATNSQGSINSKTATLRTAYISSTFTAYPTSQTLVTHSSFSLTCTIDSLPNANIMFFHNTALIQVISNARYTITAVSGGSRLNMNDIQFSDTGNYRCDALNPANSGYVTGSTIAVTVEGPPEFVTTPASQSIPERLNARLDCVAIAVPVATLTWKTPGGTNLPSTASPRFSVFSNNTLRISNVQKTDAGLYTCSASNRFGAPAASARLTVLDPLAKPSFTTLPASVTAIANTSVTLNCVASGNPSPVITWMKGNEMLKFDSRVVFLASQGVLRLVNLITEDEGQYKCTATNSEGSEMASASITVQVIPTITSPLPNLVLNEGSSLRVDCAATGKPSPSIAFGYPSSAKALTGEQGRLSIASLARTDAGQYSCTATNVAGKDQKQFSLRVQGKPYFIKKPNNVAVTTGATVTFYCDVDGDPAPTKTWTKSNRSPLPTDPRFITPSTGELQIKNVIKTDAGTYECRATNSFGEEVAPSSLTVHVFPSFSQRPDDTEIVQGGNAVFECVATGSPSPMYSWTFPNGTVVPANPIGKFLSDGGMLTIRQLTAADQGRYTCIAANAAGSISSAATVTMLTLPRFTNKPSDAIIIAGQTVKFPCSATGINQPTISWVLVPNNGVELPLTSARHSVTSTGSLTIPGIQKTDEGLYQCKATNRAGTTTAQARLTVHIEPVAYLIETTLTLTSGGNGEWRCNITEGDPPPTFKWTHASGSPLTDISRFKDSGDGLLMLKSVQLPDAGQYKCQATNYVGSSTATGTLKVQVIPTISFVSANPVEVGGNALLECNATGIPTPTITWKLAGKKIPLVNRYSQTSSGSLVISSARGADQQVYQCQAANTAGTASRNVQLKLILQPSKASKPIATNVGVHEVTLMWTISDSGGSPITGHEIQYFLGTSWKTILKMFDGNTTQVITGLTGDTEYFFRVKAKNKVGTSLYDGVASDSVKTQIGAPSAPQNFSARAINSSSIELTWTKPQFPNGPLLYYEVDYTSKDIEQIANTAYQLEDLAYTVTGLNAYITYTFRIRANNGGKALGGEYATTTATTQESVPTAAPQNVKLEVAGKPVVVISWEPPPPVGRNGRIAGYFLYYRIIREDLETTQYSSLRLEGEFTTHELPSENNVRYGVVMSMYNTFGEGPNSTEVRLQTPNVGSEEETNEGSLGSGKQAAIAIGVVCFVLLCALIVVTLYRCKSRTAVLSMTQGDEELGNDDAVGGGKERAGNGYLPDSPEVRTKNVQGKYRERQSQKRKSAQNADQPTITVGVPSTEGDADKPESPRYADPHDALIPTPNPDDLREETTGVTNAVYAHVDLTAKHREKNNTTEEESRRATHEAAKMEEEARRQQLLEQQRAQKQQQKQEEIRRKEAEASRKKQEKKLRDEETRRMKEVMKQDLKNQSARGKAAKKRTTKSGRAYSLTSDPDFGTAGLF